MLPGGTEAILLVEDDLHLRTVAQRLFEKVGYRVLAAADGAEGLASYRARARELDLVITDLVMPRPRGRRCTKPFGGAGLGETGQGAVHERLSRREFRESLAGDPTWRS